MTELTPGSLERYLHSLLGKRVSVLGMSPLGRSDSEKTTKFYGYGIPILVTYQVDGCGPQQSVLHTMSPGPFGHEHMADRAGILLWEHKSFNHLPLHVKSIDVGGFVQGQGLISLGEVDELFLLTDYIEGEGYFLDLARLQAGGELTALDLARAEALCNYLVSIHKIPGPDPGLYVRRIRELVGHGECIMGLTDSYPPDHPFFTPRVLEGIEQLCVNWRWRLKKYTYRLRQVHGDFHPWNILFQTGTNFRLLDRSRGEYGDPADDVSSLTLNYVFSSLQRSGRLEGGLEKLFQRFWELYLEKSGDLQILNVVAPFYAFRGLVMASPVWYPALAPAVRKKLFSFIRAVLEAETFDPEQVNNYCGA